jgi:oligosaccharide repeat unit polymerase
VPISLYIISIAFISGSRGYILQVILPFLVFMLYRSRKYNPYFLLFFLAFGLIVSNFIEIFRSLTVFDLNYLFDVVINNSFNLEQIIASSGELSVSVNILKLIKELNYSTESFQYGQSFIEQLSTFIPNGLLPYRPLIASEKFVYLFYNDIYNIGGGYGFFILQDGYWDFGVFGSMVSMFLFMILLNSIFIFFYRKFKEGSVFYFFLLVIFIKNMVVFSVRSGIIASLKALWIDFIPLVVFFTIIHFLNLIFWKKALK